MSMTGNYDRKNDGPCFWCLRAVKWIPVIFIGAIIVWSYYAYVIQLCFLTVTSIPERVIILILYHLVFLMFSWSYWQTIFTPVGTVPVKFRIPKNELDKLTRETQKLLIESYGKDLPVTNRTVHSSVRYCDRCVVIKPDRAHHCSVCGTCVLKMDHHCPWVNNCVNFTNYKFFVLFLGYSLVYCIYVALTVLKYFIMFWEGKLDNGMGRFHILFLFFVATMFAISLVSLFGYHIYLIFMNRTTLEAFRAPIFRVGGPDKNGYNLGKINNFIEVFGDDKKLWFLPVFTSLGDGIVYPIQQQHILPVYESMGDTMAATASIGDGVSYPTLCMDEDTESLLGNTMMRGGGHGGSGIGGISHSRLNANDDDDDDDDDEDDDNRNNYNNSHSTRIYIENEITSGTSSIH